MSSGALVFFAVLGLCPLSALFLAYLYGYRKRLHGAPGNTLEGEMARIAALLSGLFGFLVFLLWPNSPHPWYHMPGFAQLVGSLMSNPENDPNVEPLKAVVALVLGSVLALLPRLFVSAMNRKLVRDVPRYWRPEPKMKVKRR